MTYILGRGKGHDPIHRELKHIRPLSDAEELLGSQVEEEKAEQPEQRPFKVGDRVEFHGTRADNAASSCGGIRVGRITQVFPSLGRIKFKIDGDKFEWAAASDGVVNGSYENLHIRHAPRTQRPFGPEDVAEPFGWDSEGNPVICIEHDAIDKTLFVVSSSFSHEGWITLDGNKHTNIGYPHCPITRTKPAK
ncbi:hypothetical protein [Neolewinella maritima]|nr:hypothetical protein [Neolewinella maritima]